MWRRTTTAIILVYRRTVILGLIRHIFRPGFPYEGSSVDSYLLCRREVSARSDLAQRLAFHSVAGDIDGERNTCDGGGSAELFMTCQGNESSNRLTPS
jgi:hypothetical protein